MSPQGGRNRQNSVISYMWPDIGAKRDKVTFYTVETNTPWRTGPHFAIFADQYLIPEPTADKRKILPKTWLISCMTLMWYRGRTIENITNWAVSTTVLSRISNMIGTLKCPYPGLTTDTTSEILSQIQSSIRQKVRIVLNGKKNLESRDHNNV